MNSDPGQWHVGLVGGGEVGRILAEDLRAQGVAARACDLKFGMPQAGVGVEGAVMPSIPPDRVKVPLRLGGRHAAALAPQLAALGFSPKLASDPPGIACATQRRRSVMIKGLGACAIKSFTAARADGVEAPVLASRPVTFPGVHWEKYGACCFQRVIEHGRRRSEALREVAEAVPEIGPRRGRRKARPSATPGSPAWPTGACSAARPARASRVRLTGAPRPAAASNMSTRIRNGTPTLTSFAVPTGHKMDH